MRGAKDVWLIAGWPLLVALVAVILGRILFWIAG
jgi:hypothetical protein